MNIRIMYIYIYIYGCTVFLNIPGVQIEKIPRGLESLMFKKNYIWESLKTTDWNIKI